MWLINFRKRLCLKCIRRKLRQSLNYPKQRTGLCTKKIACFSCDVFSLKELGILKFKPEGILKHEYWWPATGEIFKRYRIAIINRILHEKFYKIKKND